MLVDIRWLRLGGMIVTVTEELLSNAERYAQDFDKGDLPMPPGRHVAIVACMDARVKSVWDLRLERGGCPRDS